ncbi:MAG: hypothetical protein AAGI51_10245 [Pseudomonadota bacterium]
MSQPIDKPASDRAGSASAAAVLRRVLDLLLGRRAPAPYAPRPITGRTGPRPGY